MGIPAAAFFRWMGTDRAGSLPKLVEIVRISFCFKESEPHKGAGRSCMGGGLIYGGILHLGLFLPKTAPRSLLSNCGLTDLFRKTFTGDDNAGQRRCGWFDFQLQGSFRRIHSVLSAFVEKSIKTLYKI